MGFLRDLHDREEFEQGDLSGEVSFGDGGVGEAGVGGGVGQSEFPGDCAVEAVFVCGG